jgi:phosphonoacetate hydrolase
MSAKNQRVVVMMVDGFGMDYYQNTDLPVMQDMASRGIFKAGQSIFPSLTNANNISIACGAWPDEHGVTTNCYFDESSGQAQFLEDASFLCSPTIFELSARRGMRSALLTCKAKTTGILGQDVELAVAAEEPDPAIVRQFGSAPPMYSADINYWLCEVALAILWERPEIGLLYVHTTDYPMHMWPVEHPRSQAHLKRIDRYLGQMHAAAPDAAIVVTADHGMNYKRRCWDLSKACAQRGLQLKFAVSPVADRLLKHHRGFGGVAYVYLNDPSDTARAIKIIDSLPGVEEVLDRQTAAARFRLMASRIGELVVLPDIDTVFGDLHGESETLETDYRSHGSLYETEIPLILFNADDNRIRAEMINYNLDLTRLLFKPGH